MTEPLSDAKQTLLRALDHGDDPAWVIAALLRRGAEAVEDATCVAGELDDDE